MVSFYCLGSIVDCNREGMGKACKKVIHIKLFTLYLHVENFMWIFILCKVLCYIYLYLGIIRYEKVIHNCKIKVELMWKSYPHFLFNVT